MWSAIERFATQGIQLVVMLILASQLGPEAFGLVGLLAVFISIAQVFVDSGFSNALIRKLDRSESDFSTTFYFSIAVGFLCYGLIFVCAPYISIFFEQPLLTDIARVSGLSIIISSFAIVQRAKLTIIVDFKSQAKASLSSVLISSVVGLVGAYSGFGVWSLVAQTLSAVFFNTLFLHIVLRWLPKERFCYSSFKELFGFGSKLLLSGLIERIYKNIYIIVIGKQFTVADVGQFTQADQLTSVPAMTMTAVIQRVTYPLLSNIQDDLKRLDAAYLLSLRLAAIVIFPLMFGLSAVAELLVNLLLGDIWAQAGYLAFILSFGLMLYPVHAINLNVLNVKGRSDLFLRLEIIKKVLITVVLFITVPHGIIAMCIGMVVQSYLSLAINAYYTGKLTSISMREQFVSLFPIWLVAGATTWGSYFLVTLLDIDIAWLKMVSIVTIAIILYMCSIRLMFYDLFKQLLNQK